MKNAKTGLVIVREVFGTPVEIHLFEDEVRALYDEVCKRSTSRHLGVMKALSKPGKPAPLVKQVREKEFPKMPNEHEVSK